MKDKLKELRERTKPYASITMSEDVLKALAAEEGADPRRRDGSLHGKKVSVVVAKRKGPYLRFLP